MVFYERIDGRNWENNREGTSGRSSAIKTIEVELTIMPKKIRKPQFSYFVMQNMLREPQSDDRLHIPFLMVVVATSTNSTACNTFSFFYLLVFFFG